MLCYGPGSCYPQLKFCCCGFSLRAGALALGLLFVVIAMLNIYLERQPINGLINGEHLVNKLLSKDDEIKTVALLIFHILVIFNSSLLVIGIHTNNQKIVRPYLIIFTHMCSLLICTYTLNTSFQTIMKNCNFAKGKEMPYDVLNKLALALYTLLGFGIGFYFNAVINSYYVEMVGEY